MTKCRCPRMYSCLEEEEEVGRGGVEREIARHFRCALRFLSLSLSLSLFFLALSFSLSVCVQGDFLRSTCVRCSVHVCLGFPQRTQPILAPLCCCLFTYVCLGFSLWDGLHGIGQCSSLPRLCENSDLVRSGNSYTMLPCTVPW